MTDMYAIRKPLYQEFADHIIDNNGTCQDTVRKILTILEEDL